ncbi:MAG: hypothetical protein Q8Q35_04535, partial [Nanoarchaeota archaeon]|nr:hypothetical protein [Nanoarchaeota archaeon]
MALQLQQRLEQGKSRLPSSMLGLSTLELELLLNQSLKGIENNEFETKGGNYFYTDYFSNTAKSVQGKIPQTRYLETPQIIIKEKGEKYTLQQNPILEARIYELLIKFKKPNGETHSERKIFTKRFRKEREWIIKNQEDIIIYLFGRQKNYIDTGIPLNLQEIYQTDVAHKLNLSESTICRLVKNLTIQLPDNRIIFAQELMPGQKT